MEKMYFEYQWPKDNLFTDCYMLEIYNFRYHWHEDLYELYVVLSGSLEFCIGTSSVYLNEDDVVLTVPGTGHASSALEPGTRTLVLHFHSAVFKQFLKQNEIFDFPGCRSDEADRGSQKYRELRFLAANIMKGAVSEDRPGQLLTKGAFEMLIALLLSSFGSKVIENRSFTEDDGRNETMRRMISYLEKHYSEKITLEELANQFNYNRTYVSTLFKDTVGLGFHDYLTRLRFQSALHDLASTSDTLTDIALRNGFSDLKSFNAQFREVLHRTPREYREELSGRRVNGEKRTYISMSDETARKKLDEYICLR